MVGPDFEPTIGESKIVIEIRDLIVITQSCDLANAKVQFAALCPIYGLDHFESINPDFTKRGRWESVRKGRVEGLHQKYTNPTRQRGECLRALAGASG